MILLSSPLFSRNQRSVPPPGVAASVSTSASAALAALNVDATLPQKLPPTPPATLPQTLPATLPQTLPISIHQAQPSFAAGASNMESVLPQKINDKKVKHWKFSVVLAIFQCVLLALFMKVKSVCRYRSALSVLPVFSALVIPFQRSACLFIYHHSIVFWVLWAREGTICCLTV